MSAHPPDTGLGSILSRAHSIYVSGAAAEIGVLPDLLRRHGPRGGTVTGIFTPPLNRRSYADSDRELRMRTFFLPGEVKRQMPLGLIDYCPWRYGAINRWMTAPNRFDTAILMLSPPDADGICSMGVQTDFAPSFLHGVGRIVGFINPHMPRTLGDGQVAFARLAASIECDQPLNTLVQRPADDAATATAALIAALVPDGATVQVGIGQVPSRVMAALVDHRDLRVHSGVVDDNVLLLEGSGALNRDVPIVTGTAVGTASIYEAVADNPRFSFRIVTHTHAHEVIAGHPQFRSINAVLQVDLFGQHSAESSGGRLVATPGGATDFARGALDSPGGCSIIAVRGRNPGALPNGIVPWLDAPGLATGGAVDADIVVTEFGAAHLRDLPLDRRAEALIAIAAPEDQGELERAWSRMRAGFFVRD